MGAEWKTPEALALLRQRREEGVSFRDISREIGVSDNALIGAAHRINLRRGIRAGRHEGWTEREDAILRANPAKSAPELVALLPGRTRFGITKRRKRLREGVRPRVAEPKKVAPRPVPRPTATLPPLPSRQTAREPAPAVTVAKAVEAPVAPLRRGDGCQFPFGDDKPFRFCGKPVWELSRVYCKDCHQTCYYRVRDRREDAA
jgi:hypothetical protein